MKRILVLGAGLVSRPLVRYLLDHGFSVRVASRTVSKAEALIDGHPHGEALEANMNDPARVDALVAEADVAISLLPAAYHVDVARMCLKHGKHMVTTSYVKPEMKGLDGEARARDLMILNEIGVDPGLDHMSAMRVIDGVKNAGGRVVSFRSYCGGLPAPEANTNPLGYKFSWNPRGVLVAATAPARYLEEGKIVEIPGPDLFAHMHIVNVETLGDFEAYANRDSMGYIDLYGLRETRTLYRGTFRYPGHCETWLEWVRLGLFDTAERTDLGGRDYGSLLKELTGAGEGADLKAALASKMGVEANHPAIAKLEWLEMLSEIPIPKGTPTVMDAFASRMLEKMPFAGDERDMLVLVHKFEAEYPSGKRRRITSSLIDFGIPGGDSSMARTVSLPAAVAARMVAEGRIEERGVRIPVSPAIYEPILEELKTLGIDCKESEEEA